jgi:hypothetical protein
VSAQAQAPKKQVYNFTWYRDWRAQLSRQASDLAAYENRLRAGGRAKDAAEAGALRGKILRAYARTPEITDDVNGFAKVLSYRNSSNYKLFEKHMAEARKRAPGFKALADKYGKDPGNPTAAKPGAKPAAAGGGSPTAGALEIYVTRITGAGMEFYINDKPVHRGSTIRVTAPGPFTLRAMAVGQQRKHARDKVFGGQNTIVDSQSDYNLDYTVRSGNFTGKTAWKVDREEYQWSPSRGGALGWSFETQTSKANPAVKNDALQFSFERSFTTNVSVNGQVAWKANSQRPGGARTITAEDKGDGAIFLGVGAATK